MQRRKDAKKNRSLAKSNDIQHIQQEARMGWKTLVTARAFWVSGQAAQAALRDAGLEAAKSPEAGPLPVARLIELLQDCDAVIGSSDPYNAEVFESCPRLKLVSRCGV